MGRRTASDGPRSTNYQVARVYRVINGDTVIVGTFWRNTTIRLDAIDCPEQDQYWGDIAKYGLIKMDQRECENGYVGPRVGSPKFYRTFAARQERRITQVGKMGANKESRMLTRCLPGNGEARRVDRMSKQHGKIVGMRIAFPTEVDDEYVGDTFRVIV